MLVFWALLPRGFFVGIVGHMGKSFFKLESEICYCSEWLIAVDIPCILV